MYSRGGYYGAVLQCDVAEEYTHDEGKYELLHIAVYHAEEEGRGEYGKALVCPGKDSQEHTAEEKLLRYRSEQAGVYGEYRERNCSRNWPER